MDAAVRFAEQRGGMLEIEQAAQTLLFLDRDARGVDLPVQSAGSAAGGALWAQLAWLQALALALRSRHRPKLGIGQAAGYLLGQWTTLARHVEHGQTRLDNNLVENAVRPIKMGMKSWLFVGHLEAGQRSTILYSIIVSGLRHGVESLAYLRDVLSRLPSMTNQDDFDALMPSRWQPRS